jgi:polar amino acid transport system substrate-binding protein
MHLIAIKTLLLIFSLHIFVNIHAAEIQKLTIVADDSYPPYSFIEHGTLKGVYVDIIRESAKLLSDHYEVKVIAVPWKRGLLEIKEGRAFAILPPYKHIKERPFIWPYSQPIMTEEIIAYCHKDIELLKHLQQANEKKYNPLNIGINAGYLILNKEFQYAKKMKSIIIKENRSTLANIMKLYSRQLDCYLNDQLSTEWEIAQIPKKRNIHLSKIRKALRVMSKTAHIGYTNSKHHTFQFKDDFVLKMDEAMLKVISSDKYQEIINRY